MATDDVSTRRGGGNTKEVLHNLTEVFGKILDNEIIESVAHGCNFNLNASTNALLEMVNEIDNSRSETTSQKITPKCQNGISFSYANAISTQKYRENADVIIESEKIINSRPSSSNITLDPSKNISVTSHRCSKKELEFERIIQHVRQESRILILMRGLPGSGKSYLAKTIVDRTVEIPEYKMFILSTDDYFYNEKRRTYMFEVTKLQQAHEWNQQRAYTQMSSGVSPVIIDNTNTQMWEMRCYATMAANFGYLVEIIEPFTPWAFNVSKLVERNKHNVPKLKIQEMLLRYERDITPTNLFATYNLSYVNFIPPVKRSFPPLKSKTDTNLSVVQESDIAFDEKLINQQASGPSEDSNEVIQVNSPKNSNSNFFMDVQNNALAVSTFRVDKFHSTCKLQTPNEKEKSAVSLNVSFSKLNEMDKNSVIKNQVKKPKDVYPTLNLSSWGLSEAAVSSWQTWDVVTPLNNSDADTKPEDSGNIELTKKIETSDCSTNTSSYDFSLLNTNCLTLHSDTVKIIRATGRDINIEKNPMPPTSPLKRMLLHTSSMTDEDTFDMENHKVDTHPGEHVQQLVLLFPTIPIDYLQDVYDKCQQNLNWTCDLLLDDSKVILPNTNKIIGNNSVSVEPRESVVCNLDSKVNQTKHESNGLVDLDEINRLKKCMEEKFEINQNCYSDHVIKIKNLKHNNDSNCKINQSSPMSTSNFEVYPTTSGEVVALDGDVDINEFEPDIDFPQCGEVDEQQTVEINLGDTCIVQLEKLFGFPEMFPKGFMPVVQVPLELAAQLHAFYIQSVLGQMDTQNNILDAITKEDEELAKQLQKQEEAIDDADESEPIGFQQIMKEQVADKFNRKKVDDWKKLTPDTLAAKLTMQKLVSSFPSVSETVLMEILHAHNNSYAETVEVLLASTDPSKIHDPDGTIREPPISDYIINDMKRSGEEKIKAENIPDVSKTANEYRQEANDYLKNHNEHIQKAQRAFQNRQYQVAQFYSDLAKSYTRLYEHTNSLAATAFLQEHSSRLQNFHTLDLHYLYVKEAIPALDMFLDSNINLIANPYKKNENLFVITGKGKRSIGKARIKPAVIAHLRKRKLQWIELNAGLLKVKIHPYSVTSNNI